MTTTVPTLSTARKLFSQNAAGGIRLQPLEPGDSASVLAVFDGMGKRSREHRFLTHKPRLTNGEVRALTAVDGRDHVALLASSVADGAPVGIARFVRSDDDAATAEVAVAVVDAWQRRGVGEALLAALVALAGDLGIRRLRGDVASDNDAVLRLLRRAPGRVSRGAVARGVSEFVVRLDGGPE